MKYKKYYYLLAFVFISTITTETLYSRVLPIEHHDVWCFSTARRGGGGAIYVQCGDCKSRRSTEVYDLGQCSK